jgi:hypothetical protein
MKLLARMSLNILLLVSALISVAEATDNSFTSQFLGSPLLILVALVIIDAIAFAYHRIRK